jgi:hypothetical protein
MGKVLDFKKKDEIPKRKVWNPYLKSPTHLVDEDDFGNRMDRIRESLEKINDLMKSLEGNKDVDDKPHNS